ncbi:MAG: hypothetical protein K9M98_01730 [Cephaloticoccus sp.]|nr:hypothetical protein [Cephaloticoccus sp.]MCF7759198.1 hypothetical protein [Cephaloticoccus sp.]
MKKPDLTALLTVATLFLAGPVTAQSSDQPVDPSPRASSMKMMGINQDAPDRATAEANMRAKLSENPKFMGRADTDKDGRISDDEWAIAKEKFWHHRQERMEKRREHRDEDRPAKGPQARGPKDDPAFRRGFIMGKYDANNDGRLDESERAAVRTAMEAKMRGTMEKQLARLKAVDTDNDGKISDGEWAVDREKFKEMHPGMGPHDAGMLPHPMPE